LALRLPVTPWHPPPIALPLMWVLLNSLTDLRSSVALPFYNGSQYKGFAGDWYGVLYPLWCTLRDF
jgi:hypothetical protein